MTVMESGVDTSDGESDDLLTTSEFSRTKQTGKHAVHRLRDWEPGETVWGYDIYVGEDASSTLGKTFKRDTRSTSDDGPFVEVVTEHMRRHLVLVKKPAVGFVWAATIVSVSAESAPTHDSEPPMKYALLTDVLVAARVTRE